jgi:hypothetical protein
VSHRRAWTRSSISGSIIVVATRHSSTGPAGSSFRNGTVQ